MREMGKAMMGTGEASGDRRATEAAEAAIANPLLDETSMRGAKGLLISITGGKDLTLFEVDEAATRIREEVDPDANIILGATFEEALEGVIRVSVVATGISSAESRAEHPPQQTIEQRAAEQISQRLRGLAAAANPAMAKPAAVAPITALRPAAPAMQQPRPAPQPAPAPVAAAPAPALTAFDTDPAHYGLEPPMDEETGSAEEPFIPPAPEAPTRIPRVEDFPPVAQRQIEARQQAARPVHEDRGPMSLLRRLASVGLGRREEEPQPAAEERQQPQVQRPARVAQQPQRQIPPQPRAAQPARAPGKDAMYRPAEGNLDPHGRTQPAAHPHDDELEIPAFLRRQAN
jgi:cell division protein FtsZ